MIPEAPRPATSGLQWSDAAARLRYFYAAWPDPAVRDALTAAAALAARRAGGRATPPSNLHLTLAFVGEICADRRAALGEAGAAAAAAAQRCALRIDRIGSFGERGIVWLGAEVAPVALARLATALGERLRDAGLRIERRAFRVHVTVARRCLRPLSESLAAPLLWPIDALTLVGSELRADGPRYVVVDRWPLAETGQAAGAA